MNVAIGMLDAIHSNPALAQVTLQIGINCGTAVETILGRELLPRWKLFGDTVNTASRMKSFGGPGRIHISERVRQQIMRPVVAAWKRIDPSVVKQWQSLNKHPKRFMDGTGAGSDTQLRSIEPTQLDDSLPEFLGFSIDSELPHAVKGKGMMHTHFIHVRHPSKLLYIIQNPDSTLRKYAESGESIVSDGKWLLKAGPIVLKDAAMATLIRALMVEELQRLVLTVDHTSARNLTMIGNGRDGINKPPPVVQSSRSSQILPSVTHTIHLEEHEQKHKAALVGLRFMRMLSLADTKTVRSAPTIEDVSLPTNLDDGPSSGLPANRRLPYTASSMSMRDTDTLIGRRATLGMQDSSASFVVPVTKDSELDAALGASKFLASQRSLLVGDQKDSSTIARDERNIPRVKSFSVQRKLTTCSLARSSSERLKKNSMSKSLRELAVHKHVSSPQPGVAQHTALPVQQDEVKEVLDEHDLGLQSPVNAGLSYDILAGDLHKRIRATPEEMSNAIPMPILNGKTLFFEKTAATELERLFVFYLTGAPNHHLRGCMAIVTCCVAFIFVHIASMLQTTFGITVLVLVCFMAVCMATSSILVHLKKLPCPLFQNMKHIRQRVHGTSIDKLDDKQLAALVAQHIYGVVILFFTACHYVVMVYDSAACANSDCSGGIGEGADDGHTAYHHASFHHIILMILSETLRFRFLQLTALTGGLSVLAVIALAISPNSQTNWSIGWILLNSCVALLLARSNERRRRSDFFLGYVSDEGSKETLNMLYAMLPQAIAKPLLKSVSTENEHFRKSDLLGDYDAFKCCTPISISAEELMQMQVPPSPPQADPDAAQSSLYEPSTQLVSLLMFDLVGFTKLSAAIGPHKLVTMLDRLYASFDRIVRRRQAYKVETIGDAFLVSCGAPETVAPALSAVIIAKCAIEMLRRVRSFSAPGGHTLQARIGVHLGRVMAGVISSHMPRYQVFGTEVDRVMLMESSGQPGRVHASESFINHIADAPDLQVVETLEDGTGFIERDRSAAAFSPW